MRLKTRRKKRQTNIIKKAKKGSMKCSWEVFNSFDEHGMLLVMKGICFYVDKNTKIVGIWKRKNDSIQKKYIFNKNGNITRSPKENIMIEYKKENK